MDTKLIWLKQNQTKRQLKKKRTTNQPVAATRGECVCMLITSKKNFKKDHENDAQE